MKIAAVILNNVGREAIKMILRHEYPEGNACWLEPFLTGTGELPFSLCGDTVTAMYKNLSFNQRLDCQDCGF